MSRTFKDKPYIARKRDTFPYGLRTRWNNCSIHGKLCSHGASYNKRRVLERREAAMHQLKKLEQLFVAIAIAYIGLCVIWWLR